MKESPESSRRIFLKKLGLATAATAVGPNLIAAGKSTPLFYIKRSGGHSANDNINLALIGAGGQGSSDTNTALQVPGIKLVAVCDLYDGRLTEIRAPVLVVPGSEDPRTEPDELESILAALPQAKLSWHAGAGHSPHSESSQQAVTGAVLDFLEGLPPLPS